MFKSVAGTTPRPQEVKVKELGLVQGQNKVIGFVIYGQC